MSLLDPPPLAANVRFQQSGTGSVPRSSQDELRERVHIHQFMTAVQIADAQSGAPTGVYHSVLQKALSRLADGGELELGPGEIYPITTGLTLDRRVKITGNGATLKFSGGITGLSVQKLKGSYSAGAYFTSTANTNYFTIPAGVTVAVGDFLVLSSNTTRITNYNHGIFAQVRRVAGGVAYLSASFYAAFQVDTILVYDPLFGSTVDRLNVDMTGATGLAINVTPIGMSLTGVGHRVTSCKVVGSDYASVGIGMLGENGAAVGCQTDGILNTQGITGGRIGYGISLAGNNMLAAHGSAADCKHGVTSGDRRGRCSGISYVGMRATQDPVRASESAVAGGALFGAALDFHSNVEGAVLDGCTVEGPDTLVNVRCGSAKVVKSTFVRAARTTASPLISFFEDTFSGVQVANNEVFDKAPVVAAAPDAFVSVTCGASDKTITNFAVQGNDCAGLRVFDIASGANSASTISKLRVIGNSGDGSAVRATVQIKDSIFANNVMTCYTEGVLIDCTAGDISSLTVSANQVSYHTSATATDFSYGIRVASTTANLESLISDNKITRVNASATGSTLRFTASENAVLVGNTMNADWVMPTTYTNLPVGNVNTSRSDKAHPWKGGTRVRPDGTLWAAAAPATDTWVRGERNVWNDSPSAAGTPGWVCTTGGTPGTWKAMASVAA